MKGTMQQFISIMAASHMASIIKKTVGMVALNMYHPEAYEVYK